MGMSPELSTYLHFRWNVPADTAYGEPRFVRTAWSSWDVVFGHEPPPLQSSTTSRDRGVLTSVMATLSITFM
jgi:hypothetical protein